MLLSEPQRLGVSSSSYIFSRPLPSSKLEGSTKQIWAIQTSRSISQSLEYYTGNLYPARSLAPRLKTPPIAKVSPSA